MHAAHKNSYHTHSSMSTDAGITSQTSTHAELKYMFIRIVYTVLHISYFLKCCFEELPFVVYLHIVKGNPF